MKLNPFKKKKKPLPPLGPVARTIDGLALLPHEEVKVADNYGLTFAYVTDNPFFDKMITIQTSPSTPLGQDYQTVTIGLMKDEAQKLGAALLGLVDANIGPLVETGEQPETSVE